MPRILAIDYGEKRVGLAVSDPTKTIAGALSVLPNNEAIKYIVEYAKQNDVDQIVIGEPKKLDNTHAEIIGKIENFIANLKKQLPNVKIVKYDERFTSKIAFDTIIASGIGKNKRRDKSLVDKVAATIILQDFIEASRKK